MKLALLVLCVGASVLATKANKACGNLHAIGDVSVKCSTVLTSNPCEAAIDGIVADSTVSGTSEINQWRGTRHMEKGYRDWIQLSFTKNHHVSALEVYSRCRRGTQCKTLDLTFSDGSVKRVQRPCNGNPGQSGETAHDCTGQESDTFSFSSILTDSIKIRCVNPCSSDYGFWGLREVSACEVPILHKVALGDVSVECSTVTNELPCGAAIDGIVPDTTLYTAKTQWVGTRDMNTGGRDWIQLSFEYHHHVNAVELYQRCRDGTQCSALDLTFNDGSVKRVNGPCSGNAGDGSSAIAHNCTGQGSDTFSFERILTDSVKITCVTQCERSHSSPSYFGAREVKVWALE